MRFRNTSALVDRLRAAGKVEQTLLDSAALGGAAQELFKAIVESEATSEDRESLLTRRERPRTQRMPRRPVPYFVLTTVIAICVVLITGTFTVLRQLERPSKQMSDRIVVVQTRFGAMLRAKVPQDSVMRGRIDWASLPQEVAVVNPSGNAVGYIRKHDLNRSILSAPGSRRYIPQSCESRSVPVYNHRQELVGHLSEGGFAPLGTVPSFCIGAIATVKASTGAASPICVGSRLEIHLQTDPVMLKQSRFEVILTNTGNKSCRLGGIPSVRWIDADGVPITTFVEDPQRELALRKDAKEIELAPGASAYVGGDDVGCISPLTVHGHFGATHVVLGVPGITVAPTVAIGPSETTCAVEELIVLPLRAKISSKD